MFQNDNDELDEFINQTTTNISKKPTPTLLFGNLNARDEHQELEAETTLFKSYNSSSMWAMYGGKLFAACEKSSSSLPAGQYTIDQNSNIGIFFRREEIILDDIITLTDSKQDEVIQEIEQFWTLESKFREFGFLWKRGVLLWGPAGSGKTTLVQQLSQRIVNKGNLSIYVDNPSLAVKALKMLRQVEPTRPVVLMIEDIDAVINSYGESDLLSLLDGEQQIDNVVNIATTNYPERLDRRFSNRPSRFDIIKKIGMPSIEARKQYLTLKNPKLLESSQQQELNTWLTLSEGFSLAHLKEMIISVEVLGQSLELSAKRLKLMSSVPSSTDNSFQGFNSD